ncbi:MAG: NAD-dependent succinate-semialdehyde dehydrogenase [Phycisphaeraceae bacterium]|nr:NAD-dependent succinate-semialdehyde dehydrogenase [Phycisphaeraceae bacterium]
MTTPPGDGQMAAHARFRTQNLIAGAWAGSHTGRTFAVSNPATDEHLADVPDCDEKDIARAIDAAVVAQRNWARMPAPERAKIIRRCADIMHDRIDDLATIMTLEQGKPIAEAAGEIRYAASFLVHAAGEAERVYGQTIPSSFEDKHILAIRQPVGVACAITPWNFPSAMITRKLGPALAAGCAMIVKPAELTPLSALALGDVCIDAGVPEGLVSIITGDAATIGKAMFADFRVRKISFTGSTEVGKILVRQSADNLQRLSLELGGHAPFIVFEDADIDAALDGAIACKYRNGGQTCICANRFIVHRSVHDAFVAGLVERSRALKVGIGTEKDANIGPLINDDAIEKVDRHVADARAKGATIHCGGERAKVNGGADRFYQPTVMTGITREMVCWNEETFGPVCPVMVFDDEDEAINLANDTEYGLAGYFYTRDASRLMRVAEALKFGVVGANDASPSTAQAPFGGVKMSGFGREGGHFGVSEYLDTKYVSWNVS